MASPFHYNGRKYIIKQHGFARDLPWEFVSQSQGVSAKITLRLTSNPDTLAIYPFDFELNFTYELIGKKLIIHQQYTNKSSEDMPFSAGIHPYFYTPDKSQITLEIPAKNSYDKTGESCFPFDGSLDFQQPEIDIFFTDLAENKVSFRELKRKLQVSLNFDESFFSTLVFWTVKDKEFICIEPWTSPRNSINTKEKLKYLKPGETCQTKLEIESKSLL